MARKGRKGAKKGDADDGDNVDVLPEDHTVAESVATSFDDEFDQDADAEDNIEDLLATGSAGDNSVEAATNRHARALDILSGVEDLLAEKRSTKREGGLRKIFRAVSQYGDTEVVEQFQTQLVQLCMQGLRGGSPAEQYAACRVLECMSVVLGADHDEFNESIYPNLRRVVMMTGRSMMVRGAAMRAASISNFICATDDVSTEGLLDLAEEVAGKEYRQYDVPATLRATALDCWALLATTIHDFYISGADDDHTGRGLVLFPLIQECLENTSPELRSAAGECMALIHESRLNLGEQNGDNVTERKFGTGGWEGTAQEVMFDEIQQRVSELSNQSGKNMAKKKKKQQRAAFREYVATILDNEPPDETVSFRGGSLTLSTWREVVQLNFVRHCLQGGFQIQLLTNPTLQTIFGADGHVLNSNANLSQLEKRLYLSKGSEAAKLAHVDRTKKRRVRTNVKNHFLTGDGDDI